MSNFIENETIIGNGILTAFDLANDFRAGTVKIIYNGVLFYDFYENLTDNNKIHFFDIVPSADDVIQVSYFKINQPGVLNSLKYISERQVKAMSRVSTLTALTAEQMLSYINEASKYIDAIVGYWPKYYERMGFNLKQIRTFPRLQDDETLFDGMPSNYAYIPQEITTATLYAIENIFLEGAQDEADDGTGAIVSKKLGDFSYSKANQSGPITELDFAKTIVGKKTMAILNGFIKRTGSITMDSNSFDGDGQLNSRQLKLKNL